MFRVQAGANVRSGISAKDWTERADRTEQARPSICFLFNAQLHQLLHGITTAAELARRGDVDVHVMSVSRENLAYARALVARMGGAPIRFSLAGSELLRLIARMTGSSIAPKMLTLAAIAPAMRRFDAIALPERTSIALRKLGVRRTRFIHIDHGAGDREVGVDPRIAKFDFVLMAGEKQRERFERAGLIRPGDHAIVGYPKFDAADAMRDPCWRPFDNDRPIVLYNPHFSDLGSWDRFGVQLVAAFAAQDRYNLILAPHVRMCDSAAKRARTMALIAPYADLPHIHVDLGSDRCVEMSYTTIADVYVGDVSSQVYEYIRKPGPCLFLNANGVDWQGDENYGHWHFGPVLDDVSAIVAAVDAARASLPLFEGEQRRRFDATFDLGEISSSRRAADAIAGFLHREVGSRAALPAPTRGLIAGARRAAP
ncbi:hypothetical protein CLG96_08405 [Sphingomonas oleivorans]|uniref:Glycosyl transferase n=2 Tax=Sphingomonas oleivorans TaxID=1735121 RepID=A0A2T5FY50_9SPHN|nr:hypothetical protein CLG96_08405 [Sphingomonas oleivorans]